MKRLPSLESGAAVDVLKNPGSSPGRIARIDVARAARASRILLVGPLPPPAGGGATVTRALLLSDLPQQFGVTHCDISTRRGIEQQGRFRPRNFVSAARQIAAFTRLLTRERPSLVHLPVSGTLSGFLRDAAFVRLAAGRGAAVVGHVHGGRLLGLFRDGSPAVRRLVRATFRRIDVTIALSPTWERFFRETGLTDRVTVIPNPVEAEFLAGLPAAVPVDRGSNDFHVLFVGAVGRDKGVFDLVAAAAEVAPSVPAARFTLIGPDTEPHVRVSLAEECARLGVADHVAVPGPRYGREKVAAFLDADVLCLPSYQEAFPCTILEGMAAGLPIASTTVGGIPDMVAPGVNGFLVAPGDVSGLADGLRRLAADAGLRRAMGERNAAEVRERYTVPIVVEKIAAVYRELLA